MRRPGTLPEIYEWQEKSTVVLQVSFNEPTEAEQIRNGSVFGSGPAKLLSRRITLFQ